MGNPNTFKKFIGKVISFWCGEYDPENNELLVVLEVEAIEDGWLIGITPESKRKYWFDIRQIVYFEEGDCFSKDSIRLEVAVAKHVETRDSDDE